MVSLSGRASNGGKTLAAVVIFVKEYVDRNLIRQKSEDRNRKTVAINVELRVPDRKR